MARLLDLYCCQGGAAMGYHLAGWDVTGVDIMPQPRYPFAFVQADALEYLADHGHEYDAIHASPPCHDHNSLKSLSGTDGTGWLLAATRSALVGLGRPYVLENTPGAAMARQVELCGSMFNLRAAGRLLRRHRWFETSAHVLTPPHPKHRRGELTGGVYGTGSGGQNTRGFKFRKDEAQQAMGIDWMTMEGMAQSLPPAYTRLLGEQLMVPFGECAA